MMGKQIVTDLPPRQIAGSLPVVYSHCSAWRVPRGNECEIAAQGS